jgi:hypothetical protein
LAGLSVFTTLTLRTVLILQINALDRSLFARQITSAVAFAIASHARSRPKTSGFTPSGWYPFFRLSVLVSCLGEASM